MPHPANVSYPITEYYINYYINNKHKYKSNYYEKKKRDEMFELMYKPYGGEKEYHKNALLYWMKNGKLNIL
jgi:hypothetical protein